jgi:hypothetical protein
MELYDEFYDQYEATLEWVYREQALANSHLFLPTKPGAGVCRCPHYRAPA